MSIRSSGYSQEEDKVLCQVYMDISQDPIKGVYQSSNQFWSRVMEAYENGKDTTWSNRTIRSIQSRIQTIEKATKKLHACIKQCENRRPSGASNEDIFNQAKLMLKEDPQFKTGWKLDHVWNIIKIFEKFNHCGASKQVPNPCGFEYTSLVSENPMDLDDGDGTIGGSPSQRPSGVKKSKMKRKIDDQTSTVVNILEEGNRLLLEKLEKTNAQRQHHLEIEKKNYALKELMEDNRILFCDMTSIKDPNIRAYIQFQQAEILQKRGHRQTDQQAPLPSTSFGQYFNNLDVPGSHLPKY